MIPVSPSHSLFHCQQGEGDKEERVSINYIPCPTGDRGIEREDQSTTATNKERERVTTNSNNNNIVKEIHQNQQRNVTDHHNQSEKHLQQQQFIENNYNSKQYNYKYNGKDNEYTVLPSDTTDEEEALLPSYFTTNQKKQRQEEERENSDVINSTTIQSPSSSSSVRLHRIRRKRKTYCSASLCFLLFLISLLLFVLYPRDPSIQMQKIYVNNFALDYDGLPNVEMELIGEFEFMNFNYYDMKFQNLYFHVVDANDPTIIYGTGTYNDVIETKMRTVNPINVNIETTSQTDIFVKCAEETSIRMTLGEATVEAETTGIVKKKIGTMNVNSGILTLCCTPNC